MKYLVSIFLVYLLALQVVPCCAFDDCENDREAMTATTSHPSDEKQETGTCSPFFQCGTCAAATTQTEFISYIFTPASSGVNYAEFQAPSLHRICSDYWKPPRVG